jgi:predicted TIM-barrel fold metal-dependent hydrolase
MKIDVFTHVLPNKYKEELFRVAPKDMDIVSNVRSTPTVYDLEHRFRIMDLYNDYRQVITISAPGIEEFTDEARGVDLAKLGNDELAELVSKYPDRFLAGVACLPMNNMDAALKEADRAINQLHLKGVQVYTPVNGKPLDSPEFLPLFKKMSEYDLPIWMHPRRLQNYPDYKTENSSLYRVFSVFGWPIETTIAMTRLVFSGILEKHPNLKIITHHCGGMIPYFRERVIGSYDRIFQNGQDKGNSGLTKHHIEYYKMFYNDTAINGNTSALMCAYELFGADHLLFATDMPFDTEYGARNMRQVSEAIEKMSISKEEKKQIFEGNARKLLRLHSA